MNWCCQPRTQAFLGNICGSRGARGHGKDEKRDAVLRLSRWAFPCALGVFELYSWTLRRNYRQKSQEVSGYKAVVASIRTPQPSRLSLFERLLHGTLILKGQFAAPVKRLVSRDFLSPSFSPIKPNVATYVYSFEGVFIDQFSFKRFWHEFRILIKPHKPFTRT